MLSEDWVAGAWRCNTCGKTGKVVSNLIKTLIITKYTFVQHKNTQIQKKRSPLYYWLCVTTATVVVKIIKKYKAGHKIIRINIYP